jgi:hypothetical protein
MPFEAMLARSIASIRSDPARPLTLPRKSLIIRALFRSA